AARRRRRRVHPCTCGGSPTGECVYVFKVLLAAPRAVFSSALDDRRHAHAAGGTDRNQAAARATLGELLGEGGEDAGAGSREGMADGHAAALEIQFAAIDAAQRLVEAEPVAAEVRRLPRLERAQHLCFEGLMNL